MLTTRRPVLEPHDGVAYCDLGGTLYYGDGTHPDLAADMAAQGIPRAALNEAIWGYVYNQSQDQVPHYINEMYSDFYPKQPTPDEQADLEARLEAVFPDIQTQTAYQQHNSRWTLVADSDTIGDVSTQSIDSAIQNDPAASLAISTLTQAGGRVLVVGGAVRDSVLGTNPKDIDLMCQGLSDEDIYQALATVGRVDQTGRQFGVFRFKTEDSEVEIALPRTEISTGPGHQDFSITSDPNLDAESDLARRDFTANAMAYDPSSKTLIDPHGGVDDLQEGTLSLVNDDAFRDDPLRIVRALVANARFGLQPDVKLMDALKENAQKIRHLPGERIQMELDKLLSAKDPVQAVELAEHSGVLDYLFPELSSTVGFDQKNPHHDLDVFSHTMMVLKAMTQLSNDPDMRLAALFHDSGKPDSFWQDESKGPDGGGHFYKDVQEDGTVRGADHEDVGADRVVKFMDRLHYSNERRERVEKLVRFHMFPYFDTEKGARKFLQALNGDVKMAFDLLTLREADASGKRDGTISDYDQTHLNQSKILLQKVLDTEQGVTLKDLKVNGHDMMNLGLKGRDIGQTLNELLDLIVENPDLNEKSTLLKIVEDAIQ